MKTKDSNQSATSLQEQELRSGEQNKPPEKRPRRNLFAIGPRVGLVKPTERDIANLTLRIDLFNIYPYQ